MEVETAADFHSSAKKKESKQKVMCLNMAIMGFLILYGGLYIKIPITDIHVSGPAVLNKQLH